MDGGFVIIVFFISLFILFGRIKHAFDDFELPPKDKLSLKRGGYSCRNGKLKQRKQKQKKGEAKKHLRIHR